MLSSQGSTYERILMRFGITRADALLNVAVTVALVLVIAVGGILGLSVLSNRDTTFGSTPAGRLIESVKQYVRENPNEPGARVRLGEALAAAGLIDEAVEQLEIALELDPGHTGAYINLGLIAYGTGDDAAAEALFLKVIDLTTGTEYASLNQRREVAFFYLGVIARDDERFEEAVGYLKEALRIRRDASDSYAVLAQAFMGLGEVEAAIENLTIALTFDPNFPDAHYLIGQVYHEQGDIVRASTHLRAAVDLEPDADIFWEALALLGSAEEHYEHGMTAYEGGELQEALDFALVARAIEPGFEDALRLHAAVLEEMGRLEDALAVYEELGELVSGDAEIATKIEGLRSEVSTETPEGAE